jgi:peptidoglycan/xylan/chitin deacetylase (PgdA/CDA1 family)
MLACVGITILSPGLVGTPTPLQSIPFELSPTETVSALPTVSIPATVTQPPTTAPTNTITPTFTPSPVPTPSWSRQGPGTVLVPILLYHQIAEPKHSSRYYTSPEKFDAEMKLLYQWGYATITLELMLKAIQEGADLPLHPILLTFDDGDLNVYTSAFPIMQKYGFTGVIYIVANYVGAPGYMNADQIKEMAAAGWEVGSHSMNHFDLSTLEGKRQRYEIAESREVLEAELGVPVLSFAYPYGISNSSIVDYAQFAGYTTGMSLGSSNNQSSTNLFLLQRHDVRGTWDLRQFAGLLPWQGDPILLPTVTPTP